MRRRGSAIVLVVAVAVLVSAAWLRGAEYDEQYTLFLTGGVARPVWPERAITAGEVRRLQQPQAGAVQIARDLRANDVHPPLYFWAVALWRRLMPGGLFAARLFSVLCGVVALGLVGVIARRVGVPAAMAMLLTLGCYGFVYTSVVARGFALAQVLTLAGVALLVTGRNAWAGVALGAATFANYLAAFVGCAAIVWAWVGRGTLTRPLFRLREREVVLGFAIWLPLDLWFFLAQRHSRAGQFPPFEPIASVYRLGRDFAANVFGGLPLYVTGLASHIVSVLLALLMLTLMALIPARRLLTMCVLAPPVGLLLLGLAFNNTPIELRYLAFATPFVGLLLATLPGWLRGVVLTIQVLSIIGLMTRPETMQPARATAHAAAALVGEGVVLVPRGNDGVGIVGAFAIEAPPRMRLLVIGPDELPAHIRERVGNYPRVVLALLGQDADSRAALPLMRAAFDTPCWRTAGEGFDVLAFRWICGPP